MRCLLPTRRLKQKNTYANERLDGKAFTIPHPMAMDSPAMKLLYRNMNKHYMQVEILVKQMATEIERQKKENEQQEIMKTIP